MGNVNSSGRYGSVDNCCTATQFWNKPQPESLSAEMNIHCRFNVLKEKLIRLTFVRQLLVNKVKYKSCLNHEVQTQINGLQDDLFAQRNGNQTKLERLMSQLQAEKQKLEAECSLQVQGRYGSDETYLDRDDIRHTTQQEYVSLKNYEYVSQSRAYQPPKKEKEFLVELRDLAKRLKSENDDVDKKKQILDDVKDKISRQVEEMMVQQNSLVAQINELQDEDD